MKNNRDPWSPLHDRSHHPPNPFEEQDRLDAAKREEAGLRRNDATGLHLKRGPFGFIRAASAWISLGTLRWKAKPKHRR